MFNRIFDTSVYKTQTDVYRSRVLYIAMLLLVSLYTGYALLLPEWYDRADPDGPLVTLFEVVQYMPLSAVALMFYSIYVATAAIYLLNRTGYARIASWILVGVWYIGGVLMIVTTSDFPGYASGSIVIMLVFAALLIGRQGIIVSLAVSIITLLLRSTVGDLPGNAQAALFTAMLFAVCGALLLDFFVSLAMIMRAEGTSDIVQDQLLATQVVTQIARRVSQRGGLTPLLDEIINAINDRYDYIYHTQIFMIDEKGVDARLVASTGQIGVRLLAAGHSLAVGSSSVIGQVTLRGAPVIAVAGAQDTVHRRNLLLPETRIEAAFPLRIGDKIIGALDVQSKLLNTFQDENIIAVFQALADSIALAIDNVSQFENAQARLKDNERLVEETRIALHEVERLNERLTGRVWSEYLRQRGDSIGLDLDYDLNTEKPAHHMTPTLQDATRINQFVQQESDGQQVVAFPLRVRGQVIGAMEFELDDQQAFSPEDFDLIQEVSERFGLAVENARLVDQSQRVAQREALVNQISTRLQTSNNVESMLNEAARSLKSTLNARKVAIKLGQPAPAPANGQNGQPSSNRQKGR